MKRFLICYFLFAYGIGCVDAQAAVAIKKAAPVAEKKSGGTDGAASLLPSVLGLVSGVMSMNQQIKKLTGDCIPTSAEITFVDNTVREWAKTGVMSADMARASLKRDPCPESSGGCYEQDVKLSADGVAPRYNIFSSSGDKYMIWYKYPRVGRATVCKNDALNCNGKDAETVSDIYDIFNLIDFGPADYTTSEATMAAKLLDKIETCSTARLNAKKKAMWGEFLVNTAGSIGQPTNTGTIMETVGSVSTGGAGGALNSIGGIAAQFIGK